MVDPCGLNVVDRLFSRHRCYSNPKLASYSTQLICSASMISDNLDKTPKQVGSIRSRLLRESIIEAPSYGKVSFAIPYMREHLNDDKAELETELKGRSAPCKTKTVCVRFRTRRNCFSFYLRLNLKRKYRFRTVNARRKRFSSANTSAIQTKKAPGSYEPGAFLCHASMRGDI